MALVVATPSHVRRVMQLREGCEYIFIVAVYSRPTWLAIRMNANTVRTYTYGCEWCFYSLITCHTSTHRVEFLSVFCYIFGSILCDIYDG